MKKYFLLSSVLFLFVTQINAQEKPHPYTLKTAYTGDFISNLRGGIRTGGSYIGKIDFSLAFDTELAGWQKGGKFFIRVINAHGGNPSAKLVGDIQPVSRIEAFERTSLFEFWFSQDFGRFTVLAGQFDMNSSFGVNESASRLINTSFGLYPSIALNVPLSIYPAAAASVYGKWKHSEKFSIQAAVFDGAPLSFKKNPHNIKWNISPSIGLFSTMEFQYSTRKNGVIYGTYKVGGYIHNGQFRDIVDSTKMETENYGVYITLEQRLLGKSTSDNRGLVAFLQSGTSPGNANLVDFYMSWGLVYTGVIKGRPEDVLAFGFVHSSVNNNLTETDFVEYGNSRSLLELNYNIKVSENFNFQPDLQYIIKPGADPALKDVFLASLRLAIQY